MATKTLGSLTTSNLTGVQWPGKVGATSIAAADIAAIATAIINDDDYPQILPGAFSPMGLLYIPRRGILQMRDGDWAAVDASGFPYLIPRTAAPTTLTATASGGTLGANGTGTITFSASVLVLGWRPGTYISGTNVTAGPIQSISNDGLTVTITTTGVPSGTITAGTFSHS